jgi:hypothetical protein
MRRMAWVIGMVAASGVFLATPQRAAHAAPTSFCVAGPPVQCTFFESAGAAGAPSEISDIVPVADSSGAPVPASTIALFENPALLPDDPKNWSEVIEFIPDQPGATTSHSAQMFSEGCRSGPTNETDISCFPPSANQFVMEVQQGAGDDFQDCTHFIAQSPSMQQFAQITACSDAALAEQPGPNVPEVPLVAMLPLAALGVVATIGLRRRLNKT